jgi:AcrR family transcriptional regulator
VAAAAGVDQALVHHYFGTKRQLFAVAIRIPIDPMGVIDRAAA